MSPEALAAIIGVFMPLLISLLKRGTWPTIVNLAIAGLVSLLVGAITVGVNGDLELSNVDAVLTSAATAFTAATAVYKAWFATTALNATLTGWLGGTGREP